LNFLRFLVGVDVLLDDEEMCRLRSDACHLLCSNSLSCSVLIFVVFFAVLWVDPEDLDELDLDELDLDGS